MSNQEPSQVSSSHNEPADDFALRWAAETEKFCQELIDAGFKVTDLQETNHQPSAKQRLVVTFLNAPRGPARPSHVESPTGQPPSE